MHTRLNKPIQLHLTVPFNNPPNIQTAPIHVKRTNVTDKVYKQFNCTYIDYYYRFLRSICRIYLPNCTIANDGLFQMKLSSLNRAFADWNNNFIYFVDFSIFFFSLRIFQSFSATGYKIRKSKIILSSLSNNFRFTFTLNQRKKKKRRAFVITVVRFLLRSIAMKSYPHVLHRRHLNSWNLCECTAN